VSKAASKVRMQEQRAEGPIHTSLGQRPRLEGIPIIRGLKARPMVDYRAGFQPLHLCVPWSWGVAPGWYKARLQRWLPVSAWAVFIRSSERLSIEDEMRVKSRPRHCTPKRFAHHSHKPRFSFVWVRELHIGLSRGFCAGCRLGLEKYGGPEGPPA
jgi:hypothetical protein